MFLVYKIEEETELQELRCFGEDRTLQYTVWVPGLRHETFFSFQHEGTIYGNFVSNGHDFSVDPVRRVVGIRSLSGMEYEHVLDEVIGNRIEVPAKVMRLYWPTKLQAVEFGVDKVGLTAVSDKFKGPISFVLPTQVYH